MNDDALVRVWDPLVRIFHWLLVAAFTVSYLTEGEPEWLHVWSGYLIVTLLVIRIVWGFIGSRHARFSDFVRSPGTVVRYMGDNIRGKAGYYLGHNPAGGVMVLALMLSLLITAGAGMVVLAAEEGEGPLAGWLITAESHTEEQAGSAYAEREDEAYEEEHEEQESPLAEGAEEVHEVFANITLALVIVHILGVIVESLRERQNLARAMVTGAKRRER